MRRDQRHVMAIKPPDFDDLRSYAVLGFHYAKENKMH